MKFLILLLVSACGRLDFESAFGHADAQSDDTAMVASCPDMAGVPDEDGDLVGDPCDVCPHIADADQADGDGDGVGDACDPEPANPRQRIQFFDGFNSERPEWAYGGVVQGGQYVMDVAATDTITILSLAMGTSIMQIGGTITTVAPATASIPNHLYVSTETMPNEMYYIEMIDDGSGRRRSLMYNIDSTYNELVGAQDAPTDKIQPGSFEIMLSVGTDRLDAYVSSVGAGPAPMMKLGTGTINGTRNVIYVRGLDIRFDYAVRIETL